MADSITIVLDPGHGGENRGLEYDGFLEKEMNLIVAQEMKAELEQYECVTVYITNPECKDMSLKQRAEFAKSVEADLLVSLHFNMSETHQMFGSEVWIPSVGENHAWMHTLGDIFLEELTEKGFLNRGVKTRLNGKGLDYYGILRESTALGVPSVLVEHCYADHETDASYLRQGGSLHNFAVGDATAVAKFYGLKSESLGKDYSTYVKNAYFIPEGVVGPDETAPENVMIYYVNKGEQLEGEQASFLLQAEEKESNLCYYDYSLDGGEHWTDLFAWSGEESSIYFDVAELPKDAKVMARVYNGHFLESESNMICFIEAENSEEDVAQKEAAEMTGKKDETEKQEDEKTGVTNKGVQQKEMTQAYRYKGFGFALLSGTILVVLILAGRLARHKKKYGLQIAGVVAFGAILSILCINKGNHMLLNSASESIDAETALEAVSMQTKTTEPAVLQISGKRDNVVDQAEAEVLSEQSAIQPDRETVYDIARGYLSVETVEEMPRNSYDFSRMTEQNGYRYYTDITGAIQSEVGVDVSKFQGNIDWAAVKESGISFAMIRLGLRGYGSGKLVMDEKFNDNLIGAQEQGLKTGVYFFSAAVSVEEAVEEADYVAQALSGYELQMPVVFDTEPIYYDDSRTKNLTPNQLTAITRAFCDRIREHGYTPMIYANAKRLTCVLHLEELTDIELWYADYEETPIYPYAYRMWQYTEEGTVPGIEGAVDINVYFYDGAME